MPPYYAPSPDAKFLPGAFTVTSLRASYPASALTEGKLAYCTDLFGGKGGPVMCTKYNGIYYYEPACQAPPQTVDISNADFTVVPLVTSNVLIVTGTPLLAIKKVIYSTDGAPPGYPISLRFTGSISLFGLQVAGTDAGVLNLATGNIISVAFDPISNLYKKLN